MRNTSIPDDLSTFWFDSLKPVKFSFLMAGDRRFQAASPHLSGLVQTREYMFLYKLKYGELSRFDLADDFPHPIGDRASWKEMSKIDSLISCFIRSPVFPMAFAELIASEQRHLFVLRFKCTVDGPEVLLEGNDEYKVASAGCR
jgi:hypothetical protein